MSRYSTSRLHRITSRLLTAGIACAVVGAALTFAAATAEAGTLCGTVLTKSLTLQADIVGCTGDGLVVGHSGITIDLNGHVLGAASSNRGTAIKSDGFSHITVKNGTLKAFHDGVSFKNTSYSLATNLTITDARGTNVILDGTADTLSYSSLYGVYGTSRDLFSYSDAGVEVLSGDGVTVMSNTIKHFGLWGVYVASQASGTAVRGNAVSDAGNGIESAGHSATIENNKVTSAWYWGITIPFDCTSYGCNTQTSATITGNHVDHSGYDGIYVGENEGNLGLGPVTLSSNSADYNGELGMQGSLRTFDGGGNTATGNQVSRQCENVSSCERNS